MTKCLENIRNLYKLHKLFVTPAPLPFVHLAKVLFLYQEMCPKSISIQYIPISQPNKLTR